MNRLLFTALYLPIAIIVVILSRSVEEMQLSLEITLMIKFVLGVIMSAIMYIIFKKRYEDAGVKIGNMEKGAFIIMPIFSFVWIAVYAQGMFPTFGKK